MWSTVVGAALTHGVLKGCSCGSGWTEPIENRTHLIKSRVHFFIIKLLFSCFVVVRFSFNTSVAAYFGAYGYK